MKRNEIAEAISTFRTRMGAEPKLIRMSPETADQINVIGHTLKVQKSDQTMRWYGLPIEFDPAVPLGTFKLTGERVEA